MVRMDEKLGQVTSGIADFRQENKAQFEVLHQRLEKVEQRMNLLELHVRKSDERTNWDNLNTQIVANRLTDIENYMFKYETYLQEIKTRLLSVEQKNAKITGKAALEGNRMFVIRN